MRDSQNFVREHRITGGVLEPGVVAYVSCERVRAKYELGDAVSESHCTSTGSSCCCLL